MLDVTFGFALFVLGCSLFAFGYYRWWKFELVRAHCSNTILDLDPFLAHGLPPQTQHESKQLAKLTVHNPKCALVQIRQAYIHGKPATYISDPSLGTSTDRAFFVPVVSAKEIEIHFPDLDDVAEGHAWAGEMIMEHLKQMYGWSPTLREERSYHWKFLNLNNTVVYLSGKQDGTKFVYDAIGVCAHNVLPTANISDVLVCALGVGLVALGCYWIGE